MSDLYIDSDNLIELDGLKDVETDAYINDATVKMTLCKKQVLNPSTASAAVQEVQTLLPNAPATAGTWKLTYDGQTTGDIQWNATTAQVQTALEALSNITAGDVTVGGDTLDTDPVVDGMTFTWKNTLGDVNLLTFDFSSLTGPTQAGSTMTETTKGVLKGVAVDEGGGKVGIPVLNHDLVDTGYVRLQRFVNYDEEYDLDSVKNDKIIITATYAAETFTGNEQIYVGIPNGCNITLTYVASSDGKYRGILPDTLKGLVEYSSSQTVSSGLAETGKYYLFVEAVKGTSKSTKRIAINASYDAS